MFDKTRMYASLARGDLCKVWRNHKTHLCIAYYTRYCLCIMYMYAVNMPAYNGSKD